MVVPSPTNEDSITFSAAFTLVNPLPSPTNDPEILLPDTYNEPVITALPLNGKPAPPAFSANDAVVACDEDTATLLVPKNPTALEIELVYDDAETLPAICNLFTGLVVPTPMLPLISTANRIAAALWSNRKNSFATPYVVSLALPTPMPYARPVPLIYNCVYAAAVLPLIAA